MHGNVPKSKLLFIGGTKNGAWKVYFETHPSINSHCRREQFATQKTGCRGCDSWQPRYQKRSVDFSFAQSDRSAVSKQKDNKLVCWIHEPSCGGRLAPKQIKEGNFFDNSLPKKHKKNCSRKIDNLSIYFLLGIHIGSAVRQRVEAINTSQPASSWEQNLIWLIFNDSENPSSKSPDLPSR